MQDSATLIASFSAEWDFVRWADNRMLVAARTVADPAEYFRDRGIAGGSIHALFLHMMGGQAGWLKVWSEEKAQLPDTTATGCPDLDCIEKTWPIVHKAVADYLRNLKPEELDSPRRFVRRDHQLVLPLRDTIAHMLDHCTYHRGHLNTLVKLAGGKRVWMSYWIYALTLNPQPSGMRDSDYLFS